LTYQERMLASINETHGTLLSAILGVLRECRVILQSIADKPRITYCGTDCPGHTTEPPGESCLKR
jgi:hypothetical protein